MFNNRTSDLTEIEPGDRVIVRYEATAELDEFRGEVELRYADQKVLVEADDVPSHWDGGNVVVNADTGDVRVFDGDALGRLVYVEVSDGDD